VRHARTEARAEAEAAAEQRLAAALAHKRAELVKQARSLSCMCGSWLHQACFCTVEQATDRRKTAVYAMRVAAWGMWW